MPFEPTDELGSTALRLASTLRKIGVGKLVLAVLFLILAFTGYETPRAVNVSLLMVGVNLLIMGVLCFSVGKPFRRAANDPPRLLSDALKRSNDVLFGYYLSVLVLAILVAGVATVEFLVRIYGR